MSPVRHSRHERAGPAPIFAALGDETRLALISKLSADGSLSIARLREATPLTRQAVTKHLRMLESAGLVRSLRHGRENLFKFDPAAMERIQTYLEAVSEQWDVTLARLKSFVEEGGPDGSA